MPSYDNLQATIRPPNTKKVNQRSVFLALPAEIRLQIYDLLLVSRGNHEKTPSLAAGNAYQDWVNLSIVQTPARRTMQPAILQTCRQIRCEANPILYSRNVFRFGEPEHMFEFMTQVGPTNLKLVRSLDMWIPWMADESSWVRLLDALSRQATGLRNIGIEWGADFGIVRRAKSRGLGDNVPFVRTLVNIQGLEKIHIRGYYAKHWPSYLRAETSAQVQAECGEHHEPRPDDDPHTIRWIQKLKENSLRNFKEYQEGTENLVP